MVRRMKKTVTISILVVICFSVSVRAHVLNISPVIERYRQKGYQLPVSTISLSRTNNAEIQYLTT